MKSRFVAETGLVCPLGVGARQLSASFRAGLSAYRESPVIGRSDEPHVLALVPDSAIPRLEPELEAEPLTDRERRMLRLAGLAVRQITASAARPLPLLLALPRPEEPAPERARDFLQRLAVQAATPLDLGRSRVYELGRAAGAFALKGALAALAEGHERVLVGGVDTYLDLKLLARLDEERRLRGTDVMDGFVPGEGAAFLLITRQRPSRPSTPVVIRAVGTAEDPGHRYSERPALGIGLSSALDDAASTYGELPVVRTCFAGLNGESFGSKAWGVANMRHHAHFDPALAFEHPADSFGDVGAATIPVLLALAVETLHHEQRPGPTLVWASSDHEPCGCALLATAEDPDSQRDARSQSTA